VTDYADIIEPVARLLLGEPNRALSSKDELRYGTRGALSVDLTKGTWFDHETDIGGGVFDLVAREVPCPTSEVPAWLRGHGFELDDDYHRKSNGKGKAHYANGGVKPQRRIHKVFPYMDLHGQTLFEVVRYIPKDFRQRRPDGNGGYVWNLHGVKLVPYKLPEITEAIALGHTVFVVEGEKCADLLWSYGIPATCNPMGAGKWTDELNQYLVDADVVIIGDFDPQKKNKTGELMFHDDGRPILAGQDHALSVGATLNSVASRVRVLDLAVHWHEIKPKQDVCDWFAITDHTPEVFHTLVDRAVDWTAELSLLFPTDAPDIIECNEAFPIDGSKLPRRPWEVPGLLLRRQVTLFVAPPGIGKSLLTLQISMMCARGTEWAGWRPRGKFRTLVINVEEDETEMRRRLHGARIVMRYENELKGILIAKADSIVVAKADSRTKTVTATPMLEEIIQTILAKQIDIVIVDPFAETFAGDENSNSELKWAAVLWREVARRTNCAVLLVHHAKKYAQHMAGDMDASRGGGALAGVARIVSTLFSMTEREFESYEEAIEKDFPGKADRFRFIRYDDAKANLSLMSFGARWFCKESIGIGNAGDGLPEDEVGVLIPWAAPDPFSNIDVKKANYILDEIALGVRSDDGQPTNEPYSPTKQGGSKRWVGDLIQRELACSIKDAKKIIHKWTKNGLLIEYSAKTPSTKGQERKCLTVADVKRPGTIIEESHL
jgi:KaiC/GvpD/RAD55 family RecA-like ATPase